MNPGGLVFIIILVFMEENRVRSQYISVHGMEVTLTCPESGAWYDMKDPSTKLLDNSELHKITALQPQELFEGEFTCKYKNIEHLFYFSVKVCEGCYEFNGLVAMGIIFGDLLLTGAVMLIIFQCSRKQSQPAPTETQQRAPNARSLNPPRPPNPDYEALDTRTVNSGLYSGINRN